MLPRTQKKRTEWTLTKAIEELGCAFETPVLGKEVFIVKNFAARFGLDPKLAQAQLRDNFPHREGKDVIQWGEPQWVRGDHVALRYRGNELAREKMWFQKGDPKTVGFVKYYYTGWQYRVMPATADVATVPFLSTFTDNLNDWLEAHHQRATNHFIVTAYEKEDCGIGMHSDKAKSIHHDSVIIVVKTGECGRPFRITENKGDKNDPDAELFCGVVNPGDAVIMSMDANLTTKHGVPVLQEPTAASGSIVLRAIHERVEWAELKRTLEKQEKVRTSKKRALEEEDEAAAAAAAAAAAEEEAAVVVAPPPAPLGNNPFGGSFDWSLPHEADGAPLPDEAKASGVQRNLRVDVLRDMSVSLDIKFHDKSARKPIGNLLNERVDESATIKSIGWSEPFVMERDDDGKDGWFADPRDYTEADGQRLVVANCKYLLVVPDRPSASHSRMYRRDNGVWCVSDVMCAILDTERHVRPQTEWFGGIDAHHVMMDGVEFSKDARCRHGVVNYGFGS